ncbi:hypothetical protein I0C86_41475 [Plantactinospora sp. S1510]|uniref:DUF3168 domain-containing protein n=1 Tax=Plantactinospora alkalitolerans TaxID=2789879 RepID=A0ABS0HAZ3_9ACTN|nr:hypothetical protein [Plantactinospora alkalitolerans]MBF9135324.1 hypothetical protein [Plantactinospora alkalitolerans]
MTAPLRRFPDVQRVLVTLLEPLAGVGRTGIETPGDLQSKLPFVRVIRTGGPSTRTSDYATVDVDVFAASYAAAEPLAERIRQYLTGPPLSSGAAVLDRITCESAAAELPWAPGIRRLSATYRVTARRYLAT